MTARILVVDDILANVRLLEAKLTAEYFDVVTAMNGNDALEAVQRSKPDIVLLDVMMPGIDGIEVCRRIKDNPLTQHIPIIMVTALDQPEDRVRGLEAGADDFLTKPVNDISLLCRVKSLVRLKMLTDELRIRSDSGTAVRMAPVSREKPGDGQGRILLVDPRGLAAERIAQAFSGKHQLTHETDSARVAEVCETASQPFELIVINFDKEKFDGLRLCSHLRSMDVTRHTPILVIVEPDDHPSLLRALDMGVNDYLLRPIDRQELLARVSTQIRRLRYTEQLRSSMKASIEMAITDPLTGLFNRRYLETHLANMMDHYINRGKSLSVVALDVDHFKSINDTYGHDAGDKVLKELSRRLRECTRSVDLCCRVGGEEFIVVLPNTPTDTALRIAERLRTSVALKPFEIDGPKPITVTISAGVSSIRDPDDIVEKLLKRADLALYSAKREGRNRVVLAAA